VFRQGEVLSGSKCRVCGSKTSSDERFCFQCGTPVDQLPAVDEHATSTTGEPARRWPLVLSGVAVILVLGVGFGLIRGMSESVEVAASGVVASASQSTVATSGPTVATSEPVSPSRSRTSPSPRKSTAQSASRPAAPKRTATPRPPDLSAADLDPCSGGAYPFEYALGASSSPPPAGSDERQAVANVQAILADLGYQGRSRTVPIAVDGWFGTHTEYAVRSFQRDQDIEPVGTVYRLTWEALGEYC